MKKIVNLASLLTLGLLSSFCFAQEHQTSGAVSSSYRIRPLDVINITVFQEPELNSVARVSNEGSIVLFLLGEVNVKDLTLLEAQRKITELYAKDYLVNPNISLYITEYSRQSVYVIGQVNRPGEVRIPIEEGNLMTLSRAIADAGGPTRMANMSDIIIKRKMPDGSEKVFNINLKAILRDKSTQDFPLENGDMINVKEDIF